MPRPRLPAERRKPRTSGDPRAPTKAESAHQRAVLADLAADVGAELHRRGETGAHPATWAARLGRVATNERAASWDAGQHLVEAEMAAGVPVGSTLAGS